MGFRRCRTCSWSSLGLMGKEVVLPLREIQLVFCE